MAIKINSSTPPQLGRITMPKGTYLSNSQNFDNPGGAVDGGLGGPQGNNISMWGDFTPGTNSMKGVPSLGRVTGPSYNYFTQTYNKTPQIGPSANPLQRTTPPVQDFTITGQKKNFYNELGQPVEYEQKSFWNGKETTTYNPVVHDASGNRYTWDAAKKDYVRDETGILNKKLSSPSNSLVGNDILSAPNEMTAHQLQQIFHGKTTDQIAEAMVANGYVRSYRAGVGEVYIKQPGMGPVQGPGLNQAAGPSSAFGGGFDERGRPQFVNGAALARGERVTNASGFTYVGGIPYTDKKTGTTVGQYAVTTPGPKSDPKGYFKWRESTQKDSEGNWVKVYSQEVRKVYSQRSRRLREDDEDGGGGGRQSRAEQSMNQYRGRGQQLVLLRVNYG